MRRREEHAVLTLWPFLDILSCLAGALTVVIATVLITDLIEDPVSSQPVNEKLIQINRENKLKMAEIERYREYLKAAERRLTDLQKAKEDDMRKEQELEDGIKRQAMVVSLLRQQDAVEGQIDALRKKHAQQEEQIGVYRKVNQGYQGTNVTDRIEVEYTGRGKGLKPVFVECTENGIIIYTGDKKIFVRSQNVAVSDDFRQIMKLVQSTAGATVIFLIRPAGVEAFEQAETVVNNAGVRNGKLPIPGDGVIDLGPYGGTAMMPSKS